jgi:flagellar protein FlaG
MSLGGKGGCMFSEIQSKSTTQVTPRAEAVAPGLKVLTNAQEQEQKPAVTPIPKVDIQFDAEKAHKNLEAAIQNLNDMMRDSGRTLSFSMDVKLGQPIIFVKNLSTGEVVRQIPSDVVVRVAHGIEDFKGLLHNQSI